MRTPASALILSWFGPDESAFIAEIARNLCRRHAGARRLAFGQSVLRRRSGTRRNCRVVKLPGPGVRLANVDMEFRYADLAPNKMVSTGYETLLYDCMTGDATLSSLRHG